MKQRKIIIKKTLKKGDIIPPNYVVEGVLGEGGAGVVYKASKPGRPSKAIKVLRKDGSFDREVIDAELEVAEVIGSNPYVVGVEDWGTMGSDGRKYLVFPFINGYTLKSLNNMHIERGFLVPFDITAFLLHRVNSFLYQAHNNEPKKIIHGDLCPDNIILEKQTGVPLVLDCGSGEFLKKGELVGKIPYMAPEIATSSVKLENLQLVDIYGLGMIGYEFLVGEHPFYIDPSFELDNQLKLKKEYCSQLPCSIDRRCKDVPSELSDILESCMDSSPENRPSAESLYADLGVYLYRDGFGLTAESISSYLKFFNNYNGKPYEFSPNNLYLESLSKIIHSKTKRSNSTLKNNSRNIPRTFQEAFGEELFREAFSLIREIYGNDFGGLERKQVFPLVFNKIMELNPSFN